jgi:pyruvate dehydrogenase E2 component (dihydrolipoamide acetyltransferase)
MLTLRMPQLALGSEDVTVVEWLVGIGDSFTVGTPLLTIETDKATMDVEAPFDGIVAETLCAPGDLVAVSAPIMHAREAGDAPDTEPPQTDTDGARAATVEAGAPRAASDAEPEPAAGSAESPQRVRATPSVPAGSTPNVLTTAFVTVEDGELAGLPSRRAADAAANGAPADPTSVLDDPALSGRFTERKLSRARIAIGRRLATQIPAFSVARNIDVAPALQRVQSARSAGDHVTLTDLLLEACAVAAQGVPQANAWLIDGTIREFAHVGIALAVDTPEGVIAPVVRSVESLGVVEIAAVRTDLVERTRGGVIQARELTGATISLSNVGGLQAHAVVPVVTLPQVAVLGVGAARAGGTLTCTFVGDHRALDGADGARFLTIFDAAFTGAEF